MTLPIKIGVGSVDVTISQEKPFEIQNNLPYLIDPQELSTC
jgi:hypothetical protein